MMIIFIRNNSKVTEKRVGEMGVAWMFIVAFYFFFWENFRC